jgi:hypothetical protein
MKKKPLRQVQWFAENVVPDLVERESVRSLSSNEFITYLVI